MKHEQPSDSARGRPGSVPFDLVTAFGFAVLAGVVLFLWGDIRALAAAFGVPLLLFLPGYVVVAAVFPAAADAAGRDRVLDGTGVTTAGVDGVERAALSFGVSVALLPLVALAVAISPLGFARPAVVGVFVVAVCFGALVAAARRHRLDRDQRYHVPVGRWVADLRRGLFGTDRRLVGVANALLIVSVLVATATMGYALAIPQDGESYSSIALLTENESGELEADGYATNLTAGEPTELFVSVENNEGAETDYTVVVVVQRVDPTADGVRVLEQRELDRIGATVAAGETWRQEHSVAPEMVGENLRLTYYLYRGDVPENVNDDTAYRRVYLSVDVDRGG
jgi:uncharacterized membrane protein